MYILGAMTMNIGCYVGSEHSWHQIFSKFQKDFEYIGCNDNEVEKIWCHECSLQRHTVQQRHTVVKTYSGKDIP